MSKHIIKNKIPELKMIENRFKFSESALVKEDFLVKKQKEETVAKFAKNLFNHIRDGRTYMVTVSEKYLSGEDDEMVTYVVRAEVVKSVPTDRVRIANLSKEMKYVKLTTIWNKFKRRFGR